MKRIFFSHPTGNANARAAAIGLNAAGQLKEFHTSIAAFPGDLVSRLSKVPGMGELSRRSFSAELRGVASQWPWLEAGRILSGKLGIQSLTRHESGFFSVDAVYRSLDRRVARRLEKLTPAKAAVYGYEDGCFESFRVAKSRGISRLYDLPIGYWKSARRLLEPEQNRWPDWKSTLTGFGDSAEKLARKDEELRLADHIFVASSFTKKTLEEFPGKLCPVEVIPYGFPPVNRDRSYREIRMGDPLKLLFVGGLSQRKGIADLFAAVDALGNQVELTIVGAKATEDCEALNSALTRHRWIPTLPHSSILELMREHDVFVFPSLFEGFGLVITEAMSQGTPVITTDRTAGPDLIEHERNGWLIESGSTPALTDAIEQLLRDPGQIAKVGEAAMETARRRPWEVYGNELAEAVTRVLAK